MTQSTHRPTDTGADDEDRLNEEFHTLLRTAASRGEIRYFFSYAGLPNPRYFENAS